MKKIIIIGAIVIALLVGIIGGGIVTENIVMRNLSITDSSDYDGYFVTDNVFNQTHYYE